MYEGYSGSGKTLVDESNLCKRGDVEVPNPSIGNGLEQYRQGVGLDRVEDPSGKVRLEPLRGPACSVRAYARA